MFFPALVAGPIVRADYFIPQIRENHRATSEEIWRGMWLIILGVIKKALLADYISQCNDLVFNMPGTYTGFESLMAVIGYTMQIYCDFSGYSDMAIGIALIMGYKSTNLTEFWRRWHISLSSWLRDYAPVFVKVRSVWCVFMLILIGSHAMPSRWWDSLGNLFVRSNWFVKLVVFILVVQLVLQFRSETVSPFIYFQF